MKHIILLCGPPGSGKSTLAKQYEQQEYFRISQDDQGKQHLELFNFVLDGGQNIIVDRLNFNVMQRERYLKPAREAGYKTTIIVLHESKQMCTDRCNAREGHPTIKDAHAAAQAIGMFFGKYERVQDNEADEVIRKWPDGPKHLAVIVDLDGTLANIDHRLHHVKKPEGVKKDWKSFSEGILDDKPNEWCEEIVKGLVEQNTIIYCSGRSDQYRKETVKWLNDWQLDLHQHLFMRPRNDFRKDCVIKEIILDYEILTRYKPYFAIDDRQQVVDLWRSRGIVALQCSHGDF